MHDSVIPIPHKFLLHQSQEVVSTYSKDLENLAHTFRIDCNYQDIVLCIIIHYNNLSIHDLLHHIFVFDISHHWL